MRVGIDAAGTVGPPKGLAGAKFMYGIGEVGPAGRLRACCAMAVLIVCATEGAAYADDPCDDLLAILDRPTVADSSCVVKPGRLVAELGLQYGAIKGSDQSTLLLGPQAELRYGLPQDWELKLFPPNENSATLRASAGGGRLDGLGDTAFGFKHQFGTFGGFTVAADAKLTVPTGTAAFSDGGVEGNAQAIVSYDLTKKLGITFEIGASSLTDRGDDGRLARFASANPDGVVSYKLTDQLQVYSEVYANTQTAPGKRGNVSYDGGFQYLLTKSIEIDIEAGTLLAGPAGQTARYIGAGTGLQF